MLKTITTALLLFMLAPSVIFAQKSLSLSYGIPEINWDSEGNLDGLRTVNRNGWSITLSGYNIKENGVIYGFDVGVNRYGNDFQFDRMRFNLKQVHHFSILPFIGYRHHIQRTKFSAQANLGFGLGIVPIENKTYQDDKNFQTIKIQDRDANGNIIVRPIYDLTFSGTQVVKNRVFPLVKPNIELHYAVGEKSTLFVRGTLGISLIEEVIVRDFQKVVFESKEYQVNHSTSFSYWSVELGYSLNLKK